jgi:RNA polymerase sigma factor (sigma-70 family)
MTNSRKALGRKLFEDHYALVEELIRFLARRNRLGMDEREDFTSYAMFKLIVNDYSRLRKYRGDSSFRTYLTVVMQRLFLDYRTQKWGKWRPSTTAKRLGVTAVRLETLLFRDGIDFREAREMLLSRADTGLSGEAMWELATRLPRRQRAKRVEEEVLENVGGPACEDAVVGRENAMLISNIESRLVEESGRLTDEERAILKMRFDEGKSVPEIACALNLESKALYAKIGRLLKRFRRALEASGVSWDQLEELVGVHDVNLDLERVFPSSSNPPAVSV